MPSGMGFPIAQLFTAAALGLIGAGMVYLTGQLPWRRLAAISPGAVARFSLHFLEMSVAMYVGMLGLGLLNALVLIPAGVFVLTESIPVLQLLAMAIAMAAPMILWMRVRGHDWRHGIEMGAAMLAPALIAIALVGAGLLAAGSMIAFGHAGMWLAMLVIMALRWGHYSGAGRHELAAPAGQVGLMTAGG